MKHKKLVVSGLAVAGLALAGWFSLPDDAQNAVKDTLGITQSAPTVTAHVQGRTLDQVLTDWGKDTRTVINGHPVPPMPDPKINNTTIKGVDSDNDGIRDDINRAIAEMFGNDPKHDEVVAYEKAFEYALSNPSPANTIRALDEADCILKFYKLPNGQMTMQPDSLYKKMSALTHLTVNTTDRGRVYARAWAGAGEGTCKNK